MYISLVLVSYIASFAGHCKVVADDYGDEEEASNYVDDNGGSRRSNGRKYHNTITLDDAEVDSENGKYTMEVDNCNDEDISINDTGERKCFSTVVNYPYTVSIQKKGSHFATGALVSKRWILTTAEGFYNVRESIRLFKARLGSVDCKKGGYLVPLKFVEIHPSYQYKKPSFDLALIYMGYRANYSSAVKPIKLSRIQAKILSAKFLTTYWPRLIVNDLVLPLSAGERTKQSNMRVSTQKLISFNNCMYQLQGKNVTIHESTQCLKPIVTHHSVCMPDVGAPVVAEDGLWGITSGWISSKCPNDPAPTFFTRIQTPAIRIWINTTISLSKKRAAFL